MIKKTKRLVFENWKYPNDELAHGLVVRLADNLKNCSCYLCTPEESKYQRYKAKEQTRELMEDYVDN